MKSSEGLERQRGLNLPPLHVTIGRTPENGLVLPDPSISRQHARISFGQGYYTLQDLDSANGVILNGRKLTKPARLQSGDIIQIPPYTLRFKAG